jgi:hypothetical protein
VLRSRQATFSDRLELLLDRLKSEAFFLPPMMAGREAASIFILAYLMGGCERHNVGTDLNHLLALFP